MKNIFVYSIFIILIQGCVGIKEVTEEECKNEGKILVEVKRLNLRTGQYENKNECK